MKIVLKHSNEHCSEDVTVIQAALINSGYECNRRQAEQLWEEYSNSLCAGWINLPDYRDEDAIFRSLEPFIEEVD